MILVFVAWGASSAIPLMNGGATTIAHIGSTPVDASLVQAEYQTELNQAEQNGTPDLPTRQQIAQNALAIVLRQQALQIEENTLGITAPASALRAKIEAVPAFQTNGRFDKSVFEQVLAQHDLSADRFLDLESQNMRNMQLIPAVAAAAAAPQSLFEQIFAYATQTRLAGQVSFLASTQAKPALPTPDVLQRYWKNHATQFSAPEYRSVQIVVLSPQVLALSQPVSDDEIAAAYAQASAGQNVPASRSVQLVTLNSQSAAVSLAQSWRSGADWRKIQAEATKYNASAIALDHATADQIPEAALAQAVFVAIPGSVTGPVQGALGYAVFKVTAAVTGGAPSLAAMTPQLKTQIQLQKAQAQVNADVDNVQDALAGRTPLDQLPGNLGLAAVEGTLDANGNATDGSKAPIPGGDALRATIIKAIFAAHIGDAAQLVSGPDGGYFAFTLAGITPPAVQAYGAVQDKVAAAWIQDQMNHEAEEKAASLLAVVNGGLTLSQAATNAGVPVSELAPLTRTAPPSGLPSQMLPVLFSLQPGQATMTQTSNGFAVIALEKITQPAIADDAADASAVQQSLAKAMQDDVLQSFLGGLENRGKITIDHKLLAQIYQ